MAADEGQQVEVVWPEDALWPQGGYANTVHVGHTPWDFTLRLGHIVTPAVAAGTPPGDVEISVAPVAQITMPPPALLQLALVLQDQIAKYTANYGPIGGAPPEKGITG